MMNCYASRYLIDRFESAAVVNLRKYFPGNTPLSEEAMLEGYRSSAAILDNLNAVAFSLTLGRDTLLYLSPSAKALYGETVEVFHDHPNFWLEAIHPEDKPAVWMGLDKLRETERGMLEFFYRLVASDGETTWVHHRCQIAFSEGGGALRIDCLVTPCSVGKPTPPAQYPGYEGLFLPAGDALLLRDFNSPAILEANEAAVELLGYSQAELARMSFYDCAALSEGFDSRAEQGIVEAARRGRPQRYDWLIEPKDGRPRWVEVVLSRIQLGGRDLLLVALRDIDTRKREEERLSLALEQMERGRDVVVQANPAGQITAINMAGRAMLGVSFEAVRDLFIIDLMPNWVQPHFLQTCLPLATKDGIWRGELALASREGRSLPVLLTLMAHKRGSALKGYSLIAHDIAPYKLREQRYKQAKETLESENLMKEKLLENVSAGLVRPLEELRQLVQILEKNPVDIDLALPRIKQAVNQANRLVNEAASFIAAGSQSDLTPHG